MMQFIPMEKFVWTMESIRYIKTDMESTRRKIENNPAKPKYIQTEIGNGYRMSERDK